MFYFTTTNFFLSSILPLTHSEQIYMPGVKPEVFIRGSHAPHPPAPSPEGEGEGCAGEFIVHFLIS